MRDTIIILLILVAVKAILVGSEFSFWYWYTDGKHYLEWYHNRKKFKE